MKASKQGTAEGSVSTVSRKQPKTEEQWHILPANIEYLIRYKSNK